MRIQINRAKLIRFLLSMGSMKLLPAGIRILDNLLGGGFPDGSLIVIQGFPGCGFEEFAQQFMCYGLSNGSNGVYFTLKRTAKEILQAMKRIDGRVEDYCSSGRLLFVDDYSARLKEFAVEHNLVPVGKIDFENDPFWRINTLKRLDIFVKDKMKTLNGEVRGVLDNLSYLLRTNEVSQILRFLEDLHYCVQIYGGVYFLLLVDGVHDTKTVATISDLADGVIRFVELERGTELITRMRFIKMERTTFNFKVIPHTTIRTGLLYYKTEEGIQFEMPHRIDPREVL
jgi:KaiC/GvpD/RAD55 family RecA-like ATPase